MQHRRSMLGRKRGKSFCHSSFSCTPVLSARHAAARQLQRASVLLAQSGQCALHRACTSSFPQLRLGRRSPTPEPSPGHDICLLLDEDLAPMAVRLITAPHIAGPKSSPRCVVTPTPATPRPPRRPSPQTCGRRSPDDCASASLPSRRWKSASPTPTLPTGSRSATR